MSSISKFLVFCFVFTSTTSAIDDTRESASFSLLSGIEKSALRDVLRLNPPLSTTLGDRLITCDPRRFGMPPVASCNDAISQVPGPTAGMLDRKRSYGPRGGTRRQYDVELPKRWISCKTPPCLERLEMSLEQSQDLADIWGSRREMHHRRDSNVVPFA